jgi:hypothetical protein
MANIRHVWYDTWQAYAGRAALAVILAYAFASWAIDSGSLLQYFIAFILFGYGIRAVFITVKRLRNASNR